MILALMFMFAFVQKQEFQSTEFKQLALIFSTFLNICVTFSVMGFSKVEKKSAIINKLFVLYHIQHCLRYTIAHDQCKNKVTRLQFRRSPKEYSPLHFTSIHTYIPTYITYIQHYIR